MRSCSVSLIWLIRVFDLDPLLPLVLRLMDAWILDSEATSLTTSQTKLFTSYSPSIHYIAVADVSCVVGSVTFELQPCF